MIIIQIIIGYIGCFKILNYTDITHVMYLELLTNIKHGISNKIQNDNDNHVK